MDHMLLPLPPLPFDTELGKGLVILNLPEPGRPI